MKKSLNNVLYAASDLTNFVSCSYLSFLDRLSLDSPLERCEVDEQIELIQKKGQEHEEDYLNSLRNLGKEVVDCRLDKEVSDEERAEHTKKLMKKGVEILYQAYFFENEIWHGYSDFAVRVDTPSDLGNYSYEILDTKLARLPNPNFMIQLCFHSELLEKIQGVMPKQIRLVLGDKEEHSYPISDYFAYYLKIKESFFNALTRYSYDNEKKYPSPCSHCSMCHWRDNCKGQWEKDDHLSLVANIRKDHIAKLESIDICTMEALAESDPRLEVPKLNPKILQRLQKQARLQVQYRKTGEPCYELLVPEKSYLGFALMPSAAKGDLFYDIEGDPLIKASQTDHSYDYQGGLEYLHGVYYQELEGENSSSLQSDWAFRAFWALEKGEAEKKCFEDLIDFFTDHLQKYPQARIYHYAPYEISAIKRLMCQYATREEEVDNLLRRGMLIDLYKVVRHGILVSEPRYSIKNLETFYMKKREQDLKSGGASVAYFERYLETKDPKIKEEIEEYNRIDCESTYLLRNWLIERKKEAAETLDVNFLFRGHEHDREEGESSDEEEEEGGEGGLSEKALEAIRWKKEYESQLCGKLPERPEEYTPENRFCQLLYYLLDYYRREKKPEFWEMFSRLEKSPYELMEDPECLGDIVLDKNIPPEKYKRSYLYTYRFPLQETKLMDGKAVMNPDTQEKYGPIHYLHVPSRTLQLKFSAQRKIPTYFSLIPSNIISTKTLEYALRRFVDSVIENTINPSVRQDETRDDDKSEQSDGEIEQSDGARHDEREEKSLSERIKERNLYPYSALLDILLKEKPRLKIPSQGRLLSRNSDDPLFLSELGELILNLDESYLFIQGPPGTGKTYTASHILIHLLKAGKKVGVTSNSHKAINNLLQEVETVALDEDFFFRGWKKSSKDSPENWINGRCIKDAFDVKTILNEKEETQLIAGTAWLFSREDLDQHLDYLFIDEAGQISLAHTISLGASAKNIILLGDPMQLPQPSKGIHPGESSKSVLEYILGDRATVSAQMGVFLNTTWRMHGLICRFLSQQVYEDRLLSRSENDVQKILHNCPAIIPAHSGILFLPVSHKSNSSSSEEEALKIKELYQALLMARFLDKRGQEKEMTEEDILLVAPYNLQVKKIRDIVGDNARVGTIDKFQGQQAPVVIVSMTTSSGDDLPRNLEFLFSQNRINVALSRAKSLAIVVASPELMKIRCRTLEQMSLVNMLCAVEHFSANNFNLEKTDFDDVQMTFF